MKTKIISYLLPGLTSMLFIAAVGGVMLLGNRMINIDGDLPRHILTGRLIIESRSIPTTEPFIFPYEGRIFTPHEWLTDLLFFSIFTSAGLTGLVAVTAIIIASTFLILYHEIVKQGAMRLPTLMLVIWGLAITSLNWAIRPHAISMLLFMVWITWADRLARGEGGRWWKFPLLMLLWVNLHGEFIAGILVLLAYCAGWLWDYLTDRANSDLRIGKLLLISLSASLLISPLNPSGIKPWTTILGFVQNPYLMSRMQEVNPPNFQQKEFLIILGMLAFSLFILAIRRRKLLSGRVFLLIGFSLLALYAARNLHFYGIVAPYVLAVPLSEILAYRVFQRTDENLKNVELQLKGYFWPSLVVLLLFLFSFTNRNIYSFSKEIFPVEAIRWLQGNPQKGKMFNDINWGGYIESQTWPEEQTFIDSIADPAGELTQQYENIITTSPDWNKLLEEYDISWVIIKPTSLLARELISHPDWELIYHDFTAMIFRRRL